MRIKIAAAAALVAALSSSPAPAQLFNKTVNVNGVVRQYLVYLPSGYTGSVDLPVLFTFHGGGMTSQSMLWMTGMRPLADRERFILVYPQGLVGKGGATIWNSVGPYSNGVDEIGFVAAMIDALDADYAIDRNRVYACGYSNGGNLVWELGCFASDRIAAVGAVAGSMWVWTRSLCTPTRPVAVLSIHGTQDGYNPYHGGLPYSLGLIEASQYWVQHDGANATPSIVPVPDRDPTDGSTVEHYTWADGESCFAVEHFKVIGGGHDWPGKSGNMDIDANEEIWKFVSQFDLHGRIDTVAPFGVGVGGANIGALDSRSGPSIGSVVQLELSGFSSASAGIVVLSAGPLSVPVLGGTLFVDLGTSVILPAGTDANGAGTASFAAPGEHSLIGQSAYAQAIVADGAQVAGWAFSNGLGFTLCK